MIVEANATHYMTFPHTETGSTRGDWTLVLIKNGELVRDIPIEIVELEGGVYVCTFDNDGEDKANWTLVAQDSNDTDRTYIETWMVRKPIVEKNVQQIRSHIQGEGGFFGKNSEE